jgi:hypothetical protein
LTLHSLFNGPAAIVLLLLLTLPTPEMLAARFLLPVLFASCLPLTALGSAACQEAFRRRPEDKPAGLWNCLTGLKRLPDQLAGRCLVWGATLLGSSFIVLPVLFVLANLTSGRLSTAESFLVGMIQAILILVISMTVPSIAALAGSTAIHPIISEGSRRWFHAWLDAMRETQRHPGKAAAIVLSRPVLWAITVLNLHLLVRVVLWIGDDLAGFDWAVPALVLSLQNPVYLTALILLAGLLLGPFFEASNYLLHVDARTRYEGLDLWYRVRRLFPASGKSLAGAVLLALGALMMATASARADDRRKEVIQGVREEVVRIAKEVKEADPYPGGKRWLPRLQELGKKLNEDAGTRRGGFLWFEQSITRFDRADRPTALDILRDLERRLALAEEVLKTPDAPGGKGKSKEEIKALLPPEVSTDNDPRKDKTAKERKEKKQKARREEVVIDDGPSGGGGSGIIAPNLGGGIGTIGWLICGGLLAAVLVLACILAWRQSASRTAVKETKVADAALSLEALLAQTDRPIGEGLWRQADDLARSGRWLDALRTLYLAVLALLHRADLIRYSQTRTNGEYLAQVRPRTEVYLPFEGLTDLFELKWYGEKSCQSDDYQSCRQLAEQVRGGIKN